MQKKVVKLFLLVATLFQSEFSDAQVYCGYPEVYKQTKITLDSGWGKSFVPTDIIQNFNGVWAVGLYDSNVLVARFNDTGMLEWVKQIGTDANDAQYAVRITSTDDGGAIVTGLSKIDDTRHLPWVANLNFNGDLRWIRRLEDIPGAPRNAIFTRAHVDDTGQILITGFVHESIRDYPVLVKLNRFGKVDFLKKYKDYLPSSTFTSYVSEYSDITNYLNQYVAVGTYTTADMNNPALYSGLSLGLDPGHDAGAPFEDILMSRLPDNDQGIGMAINAMGLSALNEETAIPLVLNRDAGVEFSISFEDSTIPEDVGVYLEDTLLETLTDLRSSDFTLTPESDLSDMGRFYLRIGNTSLGGNDLDEFYISIYKAASDDFVTIEGLSNVEKANVQLFNIIGQEVLNTTLNSNQSTQRVTTSGLTTGVYVIRLQADRSVIAKKIIIN